VTRTIAALIGAILALWAAASSAPAAVTIESFTAGASSTIAGAHADASTSFAFKVLADPIVHLRAAGGAPQDIVVGTPLGLVGDVSNVPRCPRSLFATSAMRQISFGQGSGGCPPDTQVGLATISYSTPSAGGEAVVGVYNVEPGPGEPALLGIQGFIGAAIAIPIHLSAGAADHYAVSATIEGVPRQPADVSTLGSSVTLWAVPGAHTRRAGGSFSRSPGEPEGTGAPESIPPDPASQWKPFMQNPTDCSQVPVTRLLVDTYEEPELFTQALALSPGASDCEHVPFAPSISLAPDTAQAGAPAGLNVDLHLPQSNDPLARGTAALEQAVVTLPAGMTVSPAAASKGLEACTDAQFGAGSDAPASCPPGSVIGEDEVRSPLLLSAPLTGKVYLGQPLSNDPTSGQMFRVFQELRGLGLDIKVRGSVVADPQSGELTATFANLPELPFEDFRLHFNGGPNAVLVNPPACAQNTTVATLYPYSRTPPATPPSSFATSYDGRGGPCPAAPPFSPSASISTASSQAGALSPLTVNFARADQTQRLARINARLPAGLLGYVSKVALCEAARAAAGTCSPESRIGTVSTSVGAGPDPLAVRGSVYLARGSRGYPFMLSVVVPALAGPYDLGDVVVPVWLAVNSDGSLTAVSGPLPSILDGVPLDIRSVTMSIDRPGLTFNPTNCNPLAMSAALTSLSGAVAAVAAPFQAAGCGSLPFAPSFTVATEGRASKANGASLTVRVTQRPGEADIHLVHVALPRQLPSRLTTLQHACTDAQFNSDPAGCPAGSVVGSARAITPTLSTPLSGPALLVSHGAAAFPDLEIVLQGEGVTIILDGQTEIRRGITSSTFASVPDVPISGFELALPEGPHSLLGATGSLCSSKLVMATRIVAWSGSQVARSTRVAVTGCRARSKHISRRPTYPRRGRPRR
jgi:hypothetical protein